jgi:hypothetical protein
MAGYRWEYSPLSTWGDFLWKRVVDPVLRLWANSEFALFRKTRGFIQIVLLVAVILLPVSLFYRPSHLLTASGLLFDIAGVLRLFLFDEVTGALQWFKENREANVPSAAMRELIMPEADPFNEEGREISRFYYERRGILFLFIGFVLQMAGDLVG